QCRRQTAIGHAAYQLRTRGNFCGNSRGPGRRTDLDTPRFCARFSEMSVRRSRTRRTCPTMSGCVVINGGYCDGRGGQSPDVVRVRCPLPPPQAPMEGPTGPGGGRMKSAHGRTAVAATFEKRDGRGRQTLEERSYARKEVRRTPPGLRTAVRRRYRADDASVVVVIGAVVLALAPLGFGLHAAGCAEPLPAALLRALGTDREHRQQLLDGRRAARRARRLGRSLQDQLLEHVAA